MAAEGNGYEETTYWYDRLMSHLGWDSLGKVLCGGVMAAGDIQSWILPISWAGPWNNSQSKTRRVNALRVLFWAGGISSPAAD